MIGLPIEVTEFAFIKAERFNAKTGMMKLIAMNSIFNQLIEII